MSTRALLLAGLLVLAGCNGLLGDETPTSSLTPAEVTGSTLPPGVTERDIVDAQRLVDAHRDAFRDGVVRTHRDRRTWANGTAALEAESRVVGSASCRRFLFTRTTVVGQFAPHELSLYANGTHVFERRAHAGGNSTGLVYGPSGERRRPCTIGVMDPLADEHLYAVLGRDGFDVEASGERVRLTARNVSMPSIAGRTGRITNVTGDVEMVVTSDGAVRRLVVTFAGETPAGRITGVRTDTFRPSDGPEPPSWVANATARDSDASAGAANASSETATATR